MIYNSRSRRRRRSTGDFWPGFVDGLSTLLLVMIFLLVVYMLAQYFMQLSISEKSEALTELDQQVAELSELLSLERQSNEDMKKQLLQLSIDLESSITERNQLTLALTKAQNESQVLTLRLQNMTSEAQTAFAEATSAKQKLSDALLKSETDEEKIRVLLSDIERLRRDIQALQTVRSDLEEKVSQLAISLENTASDRAKIEQAFTVARDRASELLSKLSDEEERTVFAQKQLREREVRLKELQELYLISEDNLETTQTLSRKQSSEIQILNQQLAALRLQLKRIEAALSASELKSSEQGVIIADLGKRLNRALAAKVEELAEYRSEFFGRLREVLANRKGFTIIGDRFVFQSEVLFRSGSADLGLRGKEGLKSFANIPKDVMLRIPSDLPWILQVDGHTDKNPIRTNRFPSNWELSSARAIEVVNYLVSLEIPPHRLSATGYGEFQPLDKRDDEIAYRRNRRIELKLTQR